MLKDSFKEYFRIWVNVKKSARESGDYSFYKWFLLQTKKELSKVYVKLKDKGWVDLVGQVLKFTTCELKEINIKYKKQNDMSVLEPSKMTNQELLDVYKKGVEWLSKDKETRRIVFSVNSLEDIDYAIDLIKQAYEYNEWYLQNKGTKKSVKDDRRFDFWKGLLGVAKEKKIAYRL